MNIYLAHNFAAREWLPKVVEMLAAQGHKCTSTWIFDDSHAKGGTKRESAQVDIEDIERSEILVLFVDQEGPTPGRGKYFELGFAYARGKRIILVGTDDGCVFYSLSQIERVLNVKELLEVLRG